MNENESWLRTLAIGVGLVLAVVIGGLILLAITSAAFFFLMPS